MKIFMSHSSRQKLFVKELRRHLPGSMALWIDERELRVGSSIEAELEVAVRQSCDFFVLIVDSNSNQSDWVKKEITWAIEREQELGQVFLLPIVVEPEAWATADARIRDRKFLTLSDFTDENISAVGRALTSEILDWLSNRLSAERTVSPGQLERKSNADLIRSADKLTSDIADVLKARLLPYRSDNPAELASFAQELRTRDGLDIASDVELVEVLDRLSSMHLLNGVEYDDELVFLSRENFSYKSSLHVTVKKKIARHATSSLRSGMTVALDGGSSVLQVARIIVRRIRTNSLQDLNIITNSIPVAGELLEEMSTLGAGDRDRVSRVFVIGGLARPVSLTTIPYEFAEGVHDLESYSSDHDAILALVGQIDVAFLGANGLYGTSGLGTRNSYETLTKRWMVQNSVEKVVLMDPTKIDIPQQVPFASFADGLRIITARLPDSADAIASLEENLRGTASTVEILE